MLEYLDSFNRCLADKAVLSAPKLKDQQYYKVKINLIKLKGQVLYQVELFTRTQVFHKNMEANQIVDYLSGLMEGGFTQLQWLAEGYNHSIRVSKKNKVLYSKSKTADMIKVSSHNRLKGYLLPEHTIIPPLVDLKIFTKEGKIVSSMYDKYKQINRFIEMIDDVLKTNPADSLNIIDFGCGKSYLTFIVYHYLNNIKKIPTTIVGMDLKEQVIDDCNDIAQKYGYDGLTFIKGDIADYQSDNFVDMVITLHACDIATDLAIYHAVNLKAKAILSVPCCQHEVNAQISNSTKTIFTRYGLIKERFAALATDAIRGNILEVMGYHTQLLEFVDLCHSPKNILIRAVKNDRKTDKSVELIKEIEDLMEEYHIKPKLYCLFEKELNKRRENGS